MTMLDKIQAGADKARTKVAAKGLREHTVKLDLRVKVGKDPLLGDGGTETPAPVTLLPAPLVDNVSVSLVAHMAGVIEAGDIQLTKVSRNTAYDELILNPATVWVIEGPSFAGEYSSVGGTLRRKNSAWEVTLRKRIADE